MSPPVRINKLLSQLGIASRRKTDQLIKEGAVTLNGEVLKKPGAMIDPVTDRLAVYGEEIDLGQLKSYLYFMVNKPKGYISTVRDTHQRQTVIELVPGAKGLFPVGRLDKDTTGLILITNDGELAHRLMHPKYEIGKVYQAEVSGDLKGKTLLNLEKGVDIKEKRLSFCKVLKVKKLKGATEVVLEIHEGKKRQIRRTFEALGYRLSSLKRISYAGLHLNIEEGSYRRLTEAEVSSLKEKVSLKNIYK